MRRRLFATLLLVLAVACTALGVWQVERRAWKLALIATVDARIHAAPRPLPTDWHDDWRYVRVRTTGTFRHDRETLVQALTERGPGWWVMTPLDTAAGTVLVNRGFVPDERRDPATRRAGQVPGPVTVTGLLRADEPGGGFLRGNDPAAGRWYSRDVQAIGRARNLARLAPWFIDAEAGATPGGYPIGGLTVVSFRNAHLVYALTWFALAGLSLFGAATVWRRPA